MYVDMSFRGTLEFDSREDLQAAVSATREEIALDALPFDLDSLEPEAEAIDLDTGVHTDEERWTVAIAALNILATFAAEGFVDAIHESANGNPREGLRIHAGGEEEELPLGFGDEEPEEEEDVEFTEIVEFDDEDYGEDEDAPLFDDY